MRKIIARFKIRSFLVLALSLSAFAEEHTRPRVVDLEQRFKALRSSPLELYAFLLRMPKGGDLHSHVSGAVYAETFIRAAAEDGLCVDPVTLSLSKPSVPGSCKIEATKAASDNDIFNPLVDSLSMRDFVPGRESAHDHFFAAFAKFGAAKSAQPASFVVEVIRRAAEQNESYLELMGLSGGSLFGVGHDAGFNGDFAETAAKLRAGGIEEAVGRLKSGLNAIEQSRLQLLKCSENPDSDACRVTVRYVYQVLREAANDQVFAQILGGFMLASQDPRVVAINLVQPEDGINSMRNYHLDMQMVEYAHQQFPKVHITLHAGELTLGLVPPEDLRFHIREAVEIGHAERIGHGVDIMYEKDANGLLELMRRRNIDVEVNLSSNDSILGVKDNYHPFPVYRKFGVPVTLSTDDEGVGRTHLTEEYQRAVLSYGLTYADVKHLARNSIHYAFLSGDAYWTDTTYRYPAKPCSGGLQTPSCRSYLEANDKARIEADLEMRFRAFEKSLP